MSNREQMRNTAGALDEIIAKILTMPPRPAADIHDEIAALPGFGSVTFGQVKRSLARLRKVDKATLFGTFAATAWGPHWTGPTY